MQKTQVQFLSGKDPLEKEMATHSNMLAWRTLRTEKPGGLQSAELQESDATQWLKHHHLLPYRTVSSLQNSVGLETSKKDILALFPVLEEGYSFPQLCMILAIVFCCFLVDAPTSLRTFPFISSLLRVFIMNHHWILSNAFLYLLKGQCSFSLLLC